MEFGKEMKIDPRNEQHELYESFKVKTKEILGDQYDGAEISEVIGCFEVEDFKEWSDKISELSERIDVDENELSSEEIVGMKIRFIGEMRMYSYLNGDRRDAKKWREYKESLENNK